MKTRSDENIRKEFLSLAKKDAVALSAVASFVKRNRNYSIPLVKPKNCSLRICGQDGTVYDGNEEQLEAWKDFYLPERMEMEVIGAIDYFPCEAFGLQLVLLLCVDGKVYAYEDEVLHLVAKNLEDLLQCGMVFPGIETFKLGECFEDMTEEENNEMMESEEIKALRESHNKFRESMELELLNTLNEIKQSRNDPLDVQKQKDSEDITSRTGQSFQGNETSCKYNVDNGKQLLCKTRHLTVDLQTILHQLDQAGLTINLKKSKFCPQEIAFLWHVVNIDGIKADPHKIEAIMSYPIPRNLKEVQGFPFVANFSQITEPKNALKKKWHAFVRSLQCEPDPTLLFVVYTDTSDHGLGAVLTQWKNYNKEVVIAYVNRSLNKAETNYSATEEKCLAVVWALEKCQHYLKPKMFTVITDQSLLQLVPGAEPDIRNIHRRCRDTHTKPLSLMKRPVFSCHL